MKNVILVFLALFSLSGFSAVKIGLVNIQKIMATVKEGKSVDKTLQKSYNAKKELIKKEEMKIVKLQEKFKKQDAVLSNAAKMKKGAEIAKKMEMVRAKVKKFQNEIRKQEAQLKKPIYDKLKPIVDEISKKQKVDMTFEMSTSPIVYAANKIDLTDMVIKAYDKKHSK